jgi:3',5'-cyclic AMP phosphodiesterase CpdA
MNRLNLLHITDLHSSRDPGVPVGDVKDKTVSVLLAEELTYRDSCALFQQRMPDVLRNQPVDLLAFTGDIGWGSQPETLKIGIRRLSALGDRLKIPRSSIVIAPGNHDLRRDAEPGNELIDFIKACEDQGFTCAARLQPKLLVINNTPIVAINTCLGGTEYAVHEIPGSFWEDIQSALGKAFAGSRDLADAMDIPAVGRTQLDKIGDDLQNHNGNCLVVLGHHSPLPTHTQEVRPYATLVDSGQLVDRLIGNGRRVMFLHGHAHCDSSLIAHSPEGTGEGFIACVGNRGLHGDDGATVSYVQLTTDDRGDFLAAMVMRYQKNSASIQRTNSFVIRDLLKEPRHHQYPIDDLETNTTFQFEEVRDKLRVDPAHSSQLASELLERSSQRQVEIHDLNRPYQEWRIIKNQ